MQQLVISCFDRTGVMVQPWAAAGYLCYIVDLQHPAGQHREGNIIRVGASVLDWLPPRGDIAFASFFPPCTDVAVSGARWYRDKGLGALIHSLQLFDWSLKIAEWTQAPYLIENPHNNVYIKQYERGPDHTFDPYEYAGWLEGEAQDNDAYTKKTWLWTGGGFMMPERRPVNPMLGSKMHLLPQSAERANLRSATPAGFARAVYEANAPHLKLPAAELQATA